MKKGKKDKNDKKGKKEEEKEETEEKEEPKVIISPKFPCIHLFINFLLRTLHRILSDVSIGQQAQA